MFVLSTTTPRPDAPRWAGRTALSAFDAISWPLLWIYGVDRVSVSTGLLGRVVIAVAVVSLLRRVHRAIWRNERYFFTAWRWGVPLVTVLGVAWTMKLAAS